MSEPDSIEWPREIWMAERDDHDQGVVRAVLSEQATVARFEGDKERDREFHRYVDGDIFDSQAKYYSAERERLRAEVERLLKAGDRLSFCAQTSGGTAGQDDDLIAAINEWQLARCAVATREVKRGE